MEQSFEQILKENMNYIKFIAHDMGYNNDEELIQIGRISLFDSYNKFDPSYNIEFSKYAGVNIRNAMKTYLSSFSRTIYLPKNIINDELKKEYEDREFDFHIISTDKKVGIDEDMSLGDILFEPEREESNYSEWELLRLKNAMKKLSKKEREVIQLRFDEELSLLETGQRMDGYTKERIRQIQNNAINKLKSALTGIEFTNVEVKKTKYEYQKEYLKKYYEENPEKIAEKKAYQAEYRKNNKEKIKKLHQEYYKENCEEIKKYSAEYIKDNREHYNELNKKHRLKKK